MDERKDAINAEIRDLQSKLSANTSAVGDWKIIKIYEARLKGIPDPYPAEELMAEREAVRNRINELQEELEGLE